ncbi:hypothetical protein MtrunA17_Chr6g0463191 [Medicago truncatula]|uniref:Uncharacterized protein n=1 Tax=Medicago truncatula TaxID=3880 RepID=A0A396HEB8_MEDTR|nr:hypothetical protein MtrunA17_Chr6g0463191 [Medicago truncatula]
MEGTRVGSFVKGGGVQVVHKSEQFLIYEHFKDDLSRHMKELVTLFSRIGVKDCEKFLSYRRPKPYVDKQDEDFLVLYSKQEMVELLTGGRKRQRHNFFRCNKIKAMLRRNSHLLVHVTVILKSDTSNYRFCVL